MAAKPLRALIVDDERLARLALRTLLARSADVVVGEASGVDDAEALIRRELPQVVFLDIQLRGENGFDLLARNAGTFHTVFVTAFDAYAVRAFEVHALDYLLKPVDPVRLANALARARNPTAAPAEVRASAYRYDDLFFHDDARSPRFIRIRDIAFIRAAGNYTELHLAAGPLLLVLRPLSTWETQLAGAPFVRVHRSLLVNLDFVERVERGEGYTYDLFVRGHAEPLPMSRRRATELKGRREAFRGGGRQAAE